MQKLQQAPIDESTRALMAPLVATLTVAQEQLAKVDAQIAQVAKTDPIIRLCATAPGVAVIVAATFVSVIDEAKRFHNAHAVSAYLGLVPGEKTTGGKPAAPACTAYPLSPETQRCETPSVSPCLSTQKSSPVTMRSEVSSTPK